MDDCDRRIDDLPGAIADIGRAHDPRRLAGQQLCGVAMAVGDLNSTKRGSGARDNAGKPALEFVPVRHWLNLFKGQWSTARHMDRDDDRLADSALLLTCVQALAEFQEGKARGDEMLNSVPPEWFVFAAEVFEFGAQKYAPWNWLKGMKWSIPIGCALRHAKAVLIHDEAVDTDSGLPHIGHFACNLIMLATYYDTYPEGNDLPGEEYFS